MLTFDFRPNHPALSINLCLGPIKRKYCFTQTIPFLLSSSRTMLLWMEQLRQALSGLLSASALCSLSLMMFLSHPLSRVNILALGGFTRPTDSKWIRSCLPTWSLKRSLRNLGCLLATLKLALRAFLSVRPGLKMFGIQHWPHFHLNHWALFKMFHSFKKQPRENKVYFNVHKFSLIHALWRSAAM